MKICDSSYLIAFLHPNPNPPKDRQDKPVTQFKERISALIEDLSASNDILGIPTPALAETLVRSGPNRAQYMKVLNDTWKFQLLPFDARAAIDTADLIAAIKKNNDQWDTWAKVKFDIQIVAIAKAEGASIIYSDDHHIENYAKRFGIRVVRICDLAPPAAPKPAPIEAGPIGEQRQLFDAPPPLFQSAQPLAAPNPDGAAEHEPVPIETKPIRKIILEGNAEDAPTPADPIRGTNEGRAEGKTASEGPAEATKAKKG